MHYDLSHLIQADSQNVLGPIQDDEALFLFALIRVMRIKTVFEIGGLQGYSARNFLKAVGDNGVVFTCDTQFCHRISENHIIIQKNVLNITPEDLQNLKIELVFFDCHDFVELQALDLLVKHGLITDDTVIALHDTNTHPTQTVPWAYKTSQGWVHQQVEREMVNALVDRGYSAFCAHTELNKHSSTFPFRHGVTIMRKFKTLEV